MRTLALLLLALLQLSHASEDGAALRGSRTAVEDSKADEEDHDEDVKHGEEQKEEEEEEEEEHGEDGELHGKEHEEEQDEEHEEHGKHEEEQAEDEGQEDEKDDSELTEQELHEKHDAELVAFAASHDKGQHCLDMVEEAEKEHGFFDSPDMTHEKLQAAVKKLNAGAVKAWKMQKAKFEPQLIERILSARKKGEVGVMNVCEEIFDMYKDF